MRIPISKSTVVLFLCSLPFLTITAQESIHASGGSATGGGSSASYSVGQLTFQTHTGANGSIAEGVQQSFEISVVTGIDQTDITLTVSVYPNPTADFLILKIKEFDLSNLALHLYDVEGKLLRKEKITSNQTTIDMSSLVPSIYLLKVDEDNKEIKTFKIIKN